VVTTLGGYRGPSVPAEPHNRARAGRAARRRALAITSEAFLTAGPGLHEVAHALADSLARAVSGGCVIRMNSSIRAWGHSRASRRLWLERMLSQCGDAFMVACTSRVAKSGAGILVSDVSPQLVLAWTSPAGWMYLEHLDMRSLLVVPVFGPDTHCGSLMLWREGRRTALTDVDLVFAEEVARRLVVTCPVQTPAS
jgi:GAF domain-containing protein